MIKGAENQERYRSYFEIVKEEDCRQAFAFLVGSAAVMRGFECLPDHHGEVRDFRYYKEGECLFAFIPNQKWLLFYIRKPAQKDAKFAREAVFSVFPEASENNSGEFTVKVSNLAQAIKLNEFITS